MGPGDFGRAHWIRSVCARRGIAAQVLRATPRHVLPQHQLLAARNDSAAHARAARFIFTAAYAHACVQIAACFHGMSRSDSEEHSGRKNKKANTAHANELALQRDVSSCIARFFASFTRRNNEIMVNAVRLAQRHRSSCCQIDIPAHAGDDQIGRAVVRLDACLWTRGATFTHEIKTLRKPRRRVHQTVGA